MSTSQSTNNATYEVTVGSPLLRPGLTITARSSERYAKDTVTRLMELVRQINATPGHPAAQ